ncbi:MAG: lytic transglycosylase domain-containing protein [Pseudomonadota bacterium]
MYRLIGMIILSVSSGLAQANNQQYELLTHSTQTIIPYEISDLAVSHATYASLAGSNTWLSTMSKRLERFMADPTEREEFLRTVYYEATRAGLDPQLVLSIIQIESGFKKYAVSHVGARGYMQIMPFWVGVIGGNQNHNLFHLRVNLRYGCLILRHYLDIEKGNYFRALGRYNGSLGEATYPQLVLNKWLDSWHYSLSPVQIAQN